MTSGSDVYIGTVDTPGSSPHILVKVSQNTAATNAGTGVTNSGTISGGQINLGAGRFVRGGDLQQRIAQGCADHAELGIKYEHQHRHD